MKFSAAILAVASCAEAVVALVLDASAARAVLNASTDEARFDHLRLSTVRIQAVASEFNWFQPFMPGGDGVGTGSGFVVQTEPYPLFVTNQHVINDAKQVTLQLLIFGEQQWHAEVVAACPTFDLALVVLKEPKAFAEALEKRKIGLKALELAQKVPKMGDNVVAMGFPLGQDSLKISKGNIAGNEEVNGNICIQSTAPISPGNSGGPLLNADGTEVVGVNFAKATQGENINYVIPVWRVQQMVRKHLKDQPDMPEDGKWKRLHVQVPKHGLTTIEANEALYSLSGGCRNGIYIAKVAERSVIRNAQPPVPDRAFLVTVNGQELDNFGTGLNTEYVADRVSFPDLFFMVPDLNKDVEFETCANGTVTKHKVSMAFKPEYEKGLRLVQEPTLDGISTKYELFGDVSVMEMTVNHIQALVNAGQPGLSRWLHPTSIAQPRLIVNYVRSGSYASEVVTLGSAVSKLNGHEVRTLAEFREHFVPKERGGQVWMLETDMGQVAALMFNQSLGEQVTNGQSAPYLMTPGVVSAATELGFFSKQAKDVTKPLLLAKKQAVDHAELPIRAAGPLKVQRQHTGAVTVDGPALALRLEV
jgi:S1-C subfamily serine protease